MAETTRADVELDIAEDQLFDELVERRRAGELSQAEERFVRAYAAKCGRQL